MSETTMRSNEKWQISYPEVSELEVKPDAVIVNKDGSFEHVDAKSFVQGAEDGILLEKGLAQRVTNNDLLLVSSVGFEEQTQWQEGRGDSLHMVEFGLMNFVATNDSVTEIPVAIKPFLTWRSGAVNELGALIKIPESTGIDSFEPLGLIRSQGTVALITRFENDVKSLDNVDWTIGINVPFRETIDVVAALQKSAFTLARLHQCGVVHNDAQIKNMAVEVHPEGKTSLRLVDLESAKQRDTSDIVERHKFLDGVHSDVAALIGSILTKGLWRDAGYDDKARAIETVFVEPYTSFLSHPGNKTESYDVDLHQELIHRVDAVLDQI